jgi:hypothetical protein
MPTLAQCDYKGIVCPVLGSSFAISGKTPAGSPTNRPHHIFVNHNFQVVGADWLGGNPEAFNTKAAKDSALISLGLSGDGVTGDGIL